MQKIGATEDNHIEQIKLLPEGQISYVLSTCDSILYRYIDSCMYTWHEVEAQLFRGTKGTHRRGWGEEEEGGIWKK